VLAPGVAVVKQAFVDFELTFDEARERGRFLESLDDFEQRVAAAEREEAELLAYWGTLRLSDGTSARGPEYHAEARRLYDRHVAPLRARRGSRMRAVRTPEAPPEARSGDEPDSAA
jgi:hypothetical protein